MRPPDNLLLRRAFGWLSQQVARLRRALRGEQDWNSLFLIVPSAFIISFLASRWIVGFLPLYWGEGEVVTQIDPAYLNEIRPESRDYVFPLLLVFSGAGMWALSYLGTLPWKSWAKSLGPTLTVAAVFISISSLNQEHDPMQMWEGLSLTSLLFGVALTLFLVRFLEPGPKKYRVAWSFFGFSVGVAVAIHLAATLVIPGGVRDSGHFEFTSNELTAQVSGRIPMVDFVAQYSNLLGFAVTPFIQIAPEQSVAVLAVFLNVLILWTVICGAIAAATVSESAGRWKAVAVSCLVILGTINVAINDPAGGREFLSPSSYLQVVPMRLVGPFTLFLALMLLLKGSRSGKVRSQLPWLLVGVLASLVLLNNSDFGAGSFVVSLALLVVVATKRYIPVARIISYLAPTGLMVLFVCGQELISGTDLTTAYFFWAREFSSQGFSLLPMAGFGAHVFFAGLFLASILAGLFFIEPGARSKIGSHLLFGVFLFLFGSFGLVTIVYFAGRSAEASLIAASFPVAGVITSGLLVFFSASMPLKYLVRKQSAMVTTVVVSVSLVLAAVPSSYPFLDYWKNLISVEQDQSADKDSFMLDGVHYGPKLYRWNRLDFEIDRISRFIQNERLTDQGQVFQAVPLSNLVAVETGFSSAMSVSHPWYLQYSLDLRHEFCAEVSQLPRPALVVAETSLADLVNEDVRCAESLRGAKFTKPESESVALRTLLLP